MPGIAFCTNCGDAHWADRPCPTCAKKLEPDEIARLRAENERLRTQEEKAFVHGYIMACTNLVSLYDEPTKAGELLDQAGIGENEIGAGLSEYDKAALAKIRRARKALEGGE